MEKSNLLEAINSIKYDTLEKHSIYFNNASIGSVETVLHQREMLKALSIYIQTLDYFYEIFDELEDVGVTDYNIKIVLGKTISILRTFKPRYYG